MVKGVGIGVGLQELLRDLGEERELRVHTDSSAAEGICKIVGLGAIRHLAVGSLWVQQKLKQKKFSLFRVRGDENPADLFTKHLNAEKMRQCFAFMGGEFREGRPEAAPQQKYDEQMIGEGMDWGLTDGPRHELAEMDADCEAQLKMEIDGVPWNEEERDECNWRNEVTVGELRRDRL